MQHIIGPDLDPLMVFQKEFFENNQQTAKTYKITERQSRLQQTTNFAISFLVFDKNKV